MIKNFAENTIDIPQGQVALLLETHPTVERSCHDESCSKREPEKAKSIQNDPLEVLLDEQVSWRLQTDDP